MSVAYFCLDVIAFLHPRDTLIHGVDWGRVAQCLGALTAKLRGVRSQPNDPLFILRMVCTGYGHLPLKCYCMSTSPLDGATIIFIPIGHAVRVLKRAQHTIKAYVFKLRFRIVINRFRTSFYWDCYKQMNGFGFRLGGLSEK